MVDFADDDLDEEFPLGDGTADTEGIVMCPYCGEPNEIGIDAGGGANQDYVEDCQVCCRPWRVTVAYDEEGNAAISASPSVIPVSFPRITPKDSAVGKGVALQSAHCLERMRA